MVTVICPILAPLDLHNRVPQGHQKHKIRLPEISFPGTLMYNDVHACMGGSHIYQALSRSYTALVSTGSVLRPHSKKSMGWIHHCLVGPGKNAETDLPCSYWEILASDRLLQKHFSCLAPKLFAS